jgi:hypothetical protein
MCAALVSPSDSGMGSPSSTGVSHPGLGPFALNLGLRPRGDPSILNIQPISLTTNPQNGIGSNLAGPNHEPPPDVLLALLARNRALEGMSPFYNGIHYSLRAFANNYLF